MENIKYGDLKLKEKSKNYKNSKITNIISKNNGSHGSLSRPTSTHQQNLYYEALVLHKSE